MIVADILMFALGIGEEIGEDELKSIANDGDKEDGTSKYVFRADNFDALQDIEANLAEATCEAAAGQ